MRGGGETARTGPDSWAVARGDRGREGEEERERGRQKDGQTEEGRRGTEGEGKVEEREKVRRKRMEESTVDGLPNEGEATQNGINAKRKKEK